MHGFIPVSKPLTNAADVAAVAHLVEGGWLSGDAPVVGEFEDLMASYTNRRFAIAVNSGTSALDLAIESLQLTSRDEVILPSFTIISCLNAVLRRGAKPIFVDVDSDTWNVSAESIATAINSRTKLIIVPHIYGLPADIEKIEQLALSQGIPLIEDSAEGLGLSIRGRPAGSFGTMAILSFYANKVITTGEGGMILTDDADLADKLKRLRNLGFNSHRRFVHDMLGWNFRMSALSAGLGLSQAKRIDDQVTLQRSRGTHYQSLLRESSVLRMPLDSHDGVENIYWVFGFEVRAELQFSARDFMSALDRRGIGSRPFFYPLHRQPVLKDYGFEVQPTLPVAERLGERGLYIPSLGTTAMEREQVAKAVLDIANSGPKN